MTVALAVASATVWAQPAAVPAATDHAVAVVAQDGQLVAQLGTQRAGLQQRYDQQLAAIDRLKNERASWRRDRALRSSLADSADTANQLAALNKQLAQAVQALAGARRSLAQAIDAELATGAAGDRAAYLARLRAQVASALGAHAKKIVLPDTQIDELADPEELEQQAQVIADTEKQLAAQAAALGQQAAELERVAELRKSHDRANDMMIRDDDQPHRDTPRTGGGTTTATTFGNGPSSPAPVTGGGAGGPAGTGGTGGPSSTATDDPRGTGFETEATYVLGEVIDPSTLDALARASRSGDPAKRAAAVRAMRDAVAAQLAQLEKKRALIEAREKELRGGH